MNEYIPELKPIETKYKGFIFRSRLEARWAVFLDALNIKWFYEYEGYDLNGLWYLPDFWLPTFNGGSFLEVKPCQFTKIELEKAERLTKLSGKSVIFAIDVPDFICYKYSYYDKCSGIVNLDYAHGLFNADKAFGGDRMFVFPGYENEDLTINERDYDCLGDHYIEAVYLARGARF